jgi:hypothetical protein
MLAQNVANSRRLPNECDVTHVDMIYSPFHPECVKHYQNKHLIFKVNNALSASPQARSYGVFGSNFFTLIADAILD